MNGKLLNNNQVPQTSDKEVIKTVNEQQKNFLFFYFLILRKVNFLVCSTSDKINFSSLNQESCQQCSLCSWVDGTCQSSPTVTDCNDLSSEDACLNCSDYCDWVPSS